MILIIVSAMEAKGDLVSHRDEEQFEVKTFAGMTS
jgi:hypothetical protein